MPARYEKIKQECISKGGGTKGCKTKAAKIENSLRKKEHKPSMKAHRKSK